MEEEIDEDRQWAEIARKSHIRWATDNPYGEDKSSNEIKEAVVGRS